MLHDEADPITEPQKTMVGRRKQSSRRTVFLLIGIISILSIGYIMVSIHYVNFKKESAETHPKSSIVLNQNSTLAEEVERLSLENDELKQNNSQLLDQNKAILEQLQDFQSKYNELSKKVVRLEEDNIALQNSLKMAASVGIKPQSYTRFSGVSSRGDIDRANYVGKFVGTAYTPSKDECGNSKGITNSGLPIIPGVSIAVDSQYWPFGTIFYIKGLGYAVAMDTGDAIKGKNRFDFAVFDKKFARILGQREWEVYLVRLGNGKVGNVKF